MTLLCTLQADVDAAIKKLSELKADLPSGEMNELYVSGGCVQRSGERHRANSSAEADAVGGAEAEVV